MYENVLSNQCTTVLFTVREAYVLQFDNNWYKKDRSESYDGLLVRGHYVRHGMESIVS